MSVHLNILCLVCINLYKMFTDHLLKGRKHFFQSIVVSVAVSKRGKTNQELYIL